MHGQPWPCHVHFQPQPQYRQLNRLAGRAIHPLPAPTRVHSSTRLGNCRPTCLLVRSTAFPTASAARRGHTLPKGRGRRLRRIRYEAIIVSCCLACTVRGPLRRMRVLMTFGIHGPGASASARRTARRRPPARSQPLAPRPVQVVICLVVLLLTTATGHPPPGALERAVRWLRIIGAAAAKGCPAPRVALRPQCSSVAAWLRTVASAKP